MMQTQITYQGAGCYSPSPAPYSLLNHFPLRSQCWISTMNKRLLVLNGIAILAVVANHATLAGYVAMFWWTDVYRDVAVPNFDQMGSFDYYFLISVQKLALFSVPAFLFVSGVFITYMARGQARLTYAVIWRRILTLIPPYLIWSTLFLAAEYVLGIKYTPWEYLQKYLTINYSTLFFIPLLISYYLLSPLLVPIAQKRWPLLLGISGLFLACGVVHSYLVLANFGSTAERNQLWRTFLPHDAFFEFFFYYTLGIVFGFCQPQMKPLLIRLRWLLLVLVVFFGIAAVVESELVYRATESIFWRSRTLTLPTVLYAISFILCYVGFENANLPFSSQLFKLGGYTLGIYLMHQLVLLFIPKIIYHGFPAVLEYQWIYIPLLVTLAVATALAVMILVKRSPARTAYRFLFG
jgi:peptidoglycan/LPS O-acetylase OafA/YrhL